MKIIDITERAKLVLGISKINNKKELRKIYHEKIKKFHPDINKNIIIENVQLIIESYKWLNNDIQKVNFLNNNKIMTNFTGKNFENEIDYNEWCKRQFYGIGIL